AHSATTISSAAPPSSAKAAIASASGGPPRRDGMTSETSAKQQSGRFADRPAAEEPGGERDSEHGARVEPASRRHGAKRPRQHNRRDRRCEHGPHQPAAGAHALPPLAAEDPPVAESLLREPRERIRPRVDDADRRLDAQRAAAAA